jgi:hypothetical protein
VLEREITGGENLQFWAKWNLNSVDVIQHVHVQISQDNGVTYQSLPAYKVGNPSQLLTSTAVDPLFAPLAAFVTANRPDLNLDIGAPAFVLNSGGEWVHAEVNLESFDGQPLRLRILSNGSIVGVTDAFGLFAGMAIADIRQGGTSLMPNSAVSSGAGKRSITLAASRSRGWRGLKDMDPCTETGWVLMESGRFNCAHRMVEALNSTRGPGAIAAGQGTVLKAATADRDVLQRAPFKYDGGVITQYFNPSYHRLVPNVRFEPANQKGSRRWPNTLDLDPSTLWLTYINDPFVLPFLCLVDASCVPDDFVAMEGVAKAMVDPGPGFDLAVTDQLAFIRGETFNQPNYRPQMFLSSKANVLGLAGLTPIWPRGTVQPDTFQYAGWLTQISDDVISTASSPFYGTPDGVRTNTTPPVDTFSDVTNQQIPYRQAFTAEFLPKSQSHS